MTLAGTDLFHTRVWLTDFRPVDGDELTALYLEGGKTRAEINGIAAPSRGIATDRAVRVWVGCVHLKTHSAAVA